MPAARRPGSSTIVAAAPPTAIASINRNAPSNGEPSSAEMAAKLPAPPMTTSAWAGASRLTRRTASAATPPPRAMSGASGPMTAPSPSETTAARKTPGSSMGVGAPSPALNPSAGECPPRPGRYRMIGADEEPGHDERDDRPPRRRAVEPEAVGQVGEDPRLEVGDEHQEPVGAGGDGDAEDRREARGARCTRGCAAWRRDRAASRLSLLDSFVAPGDARRLVSSSQADDAPAGIARSG